MEQLDAGSSRLPGASLRGKTAVVTGAARGIGLAFAEALSSVGANIAALDIVSKPSEEFYKLQQLHHVKMAYYQTDITSRAQVVNVISRVEDEFGRIDINVNAAGIVKDEPFLETTDANLANTFAVNVNGSVLVAQACARSMASRYRRDHGDLPASDASNGVIVFVASISTYVSEGAQNISTYIASKCAIKGLVKPLAMELARYGIRVNSLSPGYTMTDMMHSLKRQAPDLVRQMEKETLFGRIGTPDELKGALLYLCTDAGRWFTGQDMLIDGGATSWKHPARF